MEGSVVTSRLSETEIASALARRCREGSLTDEQRDQLLKAMQEDLAALYVVEISRELSALACRLLMSHRLRAGDAIHLASALFLVRSLGFDLEFVAFDAALTEAARRQGLDLAS